MSHLRTTTDLVHQLCIAAVFRFPKVSLGDVVMLLLALLAIAVIWRRLPSFWQRYSGGRPFNHPQKLFVNLCRAHHLDRTQQRLLLTLAQWHQLPQPATLFLRPELFETDKLGPQFRLQLSQIHAMRQRLFDPMQSPANSSSVA